MGEFDAISEKYYRAGVCLDNIEYAATAVKFGSSPELIIENLKVGHKSVNDELATAMLKDLFIANSIETKRKKWGIFALALLYSLTGFICAYYILHIIIFGGVLHRPLFVIMAAIGGITAGLFYFIRLFKTNADNALLKL